MKEILDNFKHVFLHNYANFDGRASRGEYWLYSLVVYLLYMALYIPVLIMGIVAILNSFSSRNLESWIGFFFLVVGVILLFFLIFLIPSLAVGARRLHDTGRSGWWQLLLFVPFGGLVVLVFLLQDSDEGFNEYGADPKTEERDYYRNLVAQEFFANNQATPPTSNTSNRQPIDNTQNRLI